MKTTRYREPQILSILRQAEGRVPVSELCHEHGMSNASFYKWRAKYGGITIVVSIRLLPTPSRTSDCKRLIACLATSANLRVVAGSLF
ncbi:MAG: transposase [Paracoccaceae bacterium]